MINKKYQHKRLKFIVRVERIIEDTAYCVIVSDSVRPDSVGQDALIDIKYLKKAYIEVIN